MIEYQRQSTTKARELPERSVASLLLRVVLWLIPVGLAAVVIGACVVDLPRGAAYAVPPLFTLGAGGFVMLVLISHVMRRVRRRRAAMVLSYVEQAVRLNLPLTTWLTAAAASEGRIVGRRLLDVERLLARGTPVWQAVEAATPELSERQAAVLGAGERTGRLAAALRRLLREDRRHRATEGPEAGFRVVYPTLMAIGVLLVVSMLMVFVMPKFHAIFRDFGVRLPAVTVALLNVSRTVGPWLGVAAILWFILAAARALERTFVAWRYAPPWRGAADVVAWWTPAVGTTVRSREWADFCHAMSAAVGGAMPLDAALAEAMTAVTNRVARGKVVRWFRHVEEGQPPADAARRAGMPGLIVGLIATSTRGEDLAAVFDFLARYYDMRFSRLHAVLTASAVPLITAVFALIVGFVALGLFMPMIRLVDSVDPSTWSTL